MDRCSWKGLSKEHLSINEVCSLTPADTILFILNDSANQQVSNPYYVNTQPVEIGIISNICSVSTLLEEAQS